MSVGFRKSLFGFNGNDVIEYIEKTHTSFVKKEKALNDKLDELKKELADSNENCKRLISEKEELNARLSEFDTKYEEIERLSENIGKLYLVAQTNAKAIMANSEHSVEIAADEVNRNLYSIDEAHRSLDELRRSITETSENFTAEVDRLIASLNSTREQITENRMAAESAKHEFEELYASITK